MHQYLEDILVKKYPTIFKQYGGDMKDTCMHWGIAVGKGWFKIIDNLCEKLSKYPDVVASQVKEKFGGLRFYIEGVDKDHFDEVYGIIGQAEDQAYKTCESCGEKGKRTKGGWVKVQCPKCAENVRVLGLIRKDDCRYTIDGNNIKIFNKEGIVFSDTLEAYIKLTEQSMGLLKYKEDNEY